MIGRVKKQLKPRSETDGRMQNFIVTSVSDGIFQASPTGKVLSFARQMRRKPYCNLSCRRATVLFVRREK